MKKQDFPSEQSEELTEAKRSPAYESDGSTPVRNSFSPRVSALGKSDKPAKRDFLDRDIYVTAMAALILNEKTQAPLTIGIYGPWGSGKSSFLAQLTERLPKRHPVANFNPWRLSGGGEVWAGLINEIVPIIDRHLGPLQRIRFLWSADSTRSVSKLRTRLTAASKKVGNWLTLATASGGILAAGYLQPDQPPEFLNISLASNSWLAESLKNALAWLGAYDLGNVKWDVVVGAGSTTLLVMVVVYKLAKTLFRPFSTQFKANLLQFKDDSKELKNVTFKDFEALRKIIGDFTSKRAKRHKPYLVLLIDDLDRCAPDRVVGVLEAVNSFIAELPIITVLAIDTNFVCNAVAARYRFLFAPQDGLDARERYGRLFLEKIVHIPFQLPAVRSYERYIEELLTISADATRDGELTDEEGSVVPIPSVREIIESRKGYKKALIIPLAFYVLPIMREAARKADTKQRWRIGIGLRLMFGLGLADEQRQWLSSQDYETQITAGISDSEFRGSIFSSAIRFRRIMDLARQEVLKAAIEIEESDRTILRNHTANLHGNPRGIKRFVNTYLLAKGITALTPSDQSNDIRLDDLAAWLVLLQHWPRESSILCGQDQAQTPKPLFTEDWAKRTSAGESPPEMVKFVQSNMDGLERLASSLRGLDIARCFSFFAAEA